MTFELLEGRYELRARLGAGGMGVVREALDLTCGRVVAVKMLHIAPGKDSLAVRRRFEREVATIGRLRSPHVVELMGHGVTRDGVPYLVMERLVGRDLSEVLEQERPLRADDTLAILAELGRALDAAHALGIVHRDVKPSNVFLADMGDGALCVKLLDFGIAKELHRDAFDGTTTGATVGTPCFMSPEQIMGKRQVDHRSDLWSLGVLAFRALTGTNPFQGDSVGALAVALHSGVRPSVRSLNGELPMGVDDWFGRACALSLEERFQTASELVSALATALGIGIPSSVRSSTIAQDFRARGAYSPLTATLDDPVSWVRERGSAEVALSRGAVPTRARQLVALSLALAAAAALFALLRPSEDAARPAIAPRALRTAVGTVHQAPAAPALDAPQLRAVAPLPSPSTGVRAEKPVSATSQPAGARSRARARAPRNTAKPPQQLTSPLPTAPPDADEALELDLRH
jgi:serine/threonine protein kinase